jgi:hypothetical protein
MAGEGVAAVWPWTGMGCDLCGFGSVENVDEFDPRKPCPECATVALPEPSKACNCGTPRGADHGILCPVARADQSEGVTPEKP